MSYPDNVLRLAVPDIPNAFVFVSGVIREDREYVEPKVSFAYVYHDVAAEWMPPHNPITIIRRCEADAENAKPHHIYPHQNAGPLEWSQSAVENEGLPQAYAGGHYRSLFATLRAWAHSRTEGRHADPQ